MAELVDQALDQAADVVEIVADEVADGIRGISTMSAVAAAFVAGTAGAVGGYFFADRKLRTKYEKIAEEEIDQMREHFRQRLVARETPKPSVEELGRVTAELGYDTPAQPWPKSDPPIPVPDAEVETKNVFEEQFVWDAEGEKAGRSEDEPYVIHVDERSDDEYTQTTMTYYEGDDVLCDSSDRVITEVDTVVGVSNLDRFGHGSNDPNIVYIRNEALAIDVEVVKSEGTYEEEVMGLKHSESHDKPTAWDG